MFCLKLRLQIAGLSPWIFNRLLDAFTMLGISIPPLTYLFIFIHSCTDLLVAFFAVVLHDSLEVRDTEEKHPYFCKYQVSIVTPLASLTLSPLSYVSEMLIRGHFYLKAP